MTLPYLFPGILCTTIGLPKNSQAKHPTPYKPEPQNNGALNPKPAKPKPTITSPKPYAHNFKPQTPTPTTLNPKPTISSPKPYTHNLKPQTLHLKPQGTKHPNKKAKNPKAQDQVSSILCGVTMEPNIE